MGKPKELNVGLRIRELRQEQRLSLRQLAAASGLSANAISMIERGENSPTVSTLHALAGGLAVSVADLFLDGTEQSVILVRQTDRAHTHAGNAVLESLGHGLRNQQFEPYLVTLAEDANAFSQPVSHRGEEFVLCLEGEIDYVVDDQVYGLGSGDSLIFDASRPHSFRNAGEAPASFVMLYVAGISPHLFNGIKAKKP